MANLTELAPRVLTKLKVLAAGETPSAEDFELAKQTLRSVHASLRIEGLLRWTLNDIPDFAENPYVIMAAALCASDFGATADQSWYQGGLSQIQKGVALPANGISRAEYF